MRPYTLNNISCETLVLETEVYSPVPIKERIGLHSPTQKHGQENYQCNPDSHWVGTDFFFENVQFATPLK
jgi:hypothetical protein